MIIKSLYGGRTTAGIIHIPNVSGCAVLPNSASSFLLPGKNYACPMQQTNCICSDAALVSLLHHNWHHQHSHCLWLWLPAQEAHPLSAILAIGMEAEGGDKAQGCN